MDSNFISRPPSTDLLSSLVDYFFFIDIPVSELRIRQEYILPFPRVTFGYFFDYPFEATNHALGETKTARMGMSRVTSDRITVQPTGKRVKIAGAHMRPFMPGYLSQKPVCELPWLTDLEALFGHSAVDFRKSMDECDIPDRMFELMENLVSQNMLDRDLSVVAGAVNSIEQHGGEVKLNTLAGEAGISVRALRDHFYKYVGCAPAQYIRLVKLKYALYMMQNSDESLTSIAHNGEYVDQSHFVNTVKKITGKSPKALRKEMSDFRFLQF